MRLQHYIISVFLLLWNSLLFAQSQDLYIVNIKGEVISEENSEPVAYAHIINMRVHGGTTTNADGIFAIRMLTEDTLIIKSVGFVDLIFTIDEFPPKESYTLKLKPVRYLIKEITVSEELNMRKRLGLPDTKPLNIPVELRGDAFNEKPPWFVAFLSPISFMQYHLSEREKNKREILKVIKNNEEWLLFSEYHNLENIKRITGLNEKEADNFMLYCNINNKLPYFAGEMEIEFQIMNLFFKYKKEQDSIIDLKPE